ncbi:MAG TPA: APC family permease [Polyangiaceae bacterium]|nr:APC family permease [Polyangiaceae bacterium]
MKQPVGALSLLALGLNGIIGVGIFFTPNLIAAQLPGRAAMWAFPATALALLPIAVAFATLGGRVGLDGGPYVWARAAFGSRAAAWVGWVAFVSALLSTAAVFAGLRDFLAADLGLRGAGEKAAFTAACVFAFAVIAALGLRPSTWTWNLLTVLKLVPLLLLGASALSVGLGLWPRPTLLTESIGPPSLGATRPMATAFGSIEFERLARALLLCVFPLQGFEIVPVLSGSARSPRAIAVATVGSLLGAAGLYAWIVAACVDAVPALATSSSPLTDAAYALGGTSLRRVVAWGTHVSALGIAFGMIVMTPRYLAALGNPSALGARLGDLDSRAVPQRALWLCASIVAVLVSVQGLASLFVLSSSAVLIQYVAALAALLLFGWQRRFGLTRRSLVWPLAGTIAVGSLMHAVELRELVVLASALLLGGLLLYARHPARAPKPPTE